MDSELVVQWYDVTPPARLTGPFYVGKVTHGTGRIHPGAFTIKCTFVSGAAQRLSMGYNCLRVDNVPLMQMDELAQNFLILAEARYGN